MGPRHHAGFFANGIGLQKMSDDGIKSELNT